MKIDNYIRHLELQRKGLKEKHNNLQGASDITFSEKGYTCTLKKRLDPNFKEITETRHNIKELNNKLEFLTKLRKELINNEVQNQTNKQR